MKRQAATRYAAGLTIAATLAVAGCTGDPAPTQTASSTASGTGTTSSTPKTTSTTTSATPKTSTTTQAVDPNIPAAAKAETIDGAQEFTKYFFKVIGRSWSQPDPTATDTYALPSCKACAAYRVTAADTKDKGWRYLGEPVTVISAVTARLVDGKAEVSVTGEQRKASVVDANGKTVQEVPPNPHVDSVVSLSYSNGWKVSEIKAIQQ